MLGFLTGANLAFWPRPPAIAFYAPFGERQCKSQARYECHDEQAQRHLGSPESDVRAESQDTIEYHNRFRDPNLRKAALALLWQKCEMRC